MSVTDEAKALFLCPPERIWPVLCGEEFFSRWYGYPEPLELLEIDPGFSVGAKLTFKNSRSSAVITELETEKKLTVSSGFSVDEIIIERQQAGCFVTIRRRRNNDQDASDINPAEVMLVRLHDICLSNEIPIAARREQKQESVTASLFQGYRSPVRKSKRDAQNGIDLFDNTETDVAVAPRSAFVAVLLTVLLFCVLVFTFAFERSDVVPSTGLSVMESAGVNRQNAENIYPGQGKNDLEVMLSCRGLRLSTNEYYYCSLDKDGAGEAYEQIYVLYDAYGKVRSFAYVDRTVSGQHVDFKYWDIEQEINSDMSITNIEKCVESPLSAFRIDKSGTREVFFGEMDSKESVFSGELRSELVIKIDESAPNPVSANFYLPPDRRSSLPNGLTDLLSRQYRNLSVYLADKDAYDRLQMLIGRSKSELDVVLGAGEYITADGITVGAYSAYSSADPSVIYEYSAIFDGSENAAEITYTNRYLCELSGTLAPLESYDLYRGMSLVTLYETLQMIPVSARITADTLTLCFGDYIEAAELEESATLVVVVDLTYRNVTEIYYN